MLSAPSPRRFAVFQLLLAVFLAASGGLRSSGQTTLSGTYTSSDNGTTLSGTSFSIAPSTTATFTSGANFASAASLAIGNSATFNWNQIGVLTGTTITAGSGSGAYASIGVGNANSLTFGPGASVTGGFNIYGNSGATIINQGAITKAASSYYYSYLYAPILTNQGGVTANSGVLYFGYYNGETTTNALGGTITADGSSTSVYLHSLANLGTLTAQNGGTLVFTGTNSSTSTTSLNSGTINAAGGRAYLNGTVDNLNGTLNAPTTGIFELYGGTISGGTVAQNAITFTSSGGTLSGVNYASDFTLPDSTNVTFTNGTSFTGSNAALGNSSTLYWNQNGTLTGKTIAAGSGSGAYTYIGVGSNNSLTFDAGTTVTGGFDIYGGTGATIINQGTITKPANSYYYAYLYAPTFTNQGSITASSGALYVGYYNGETTTNASTGTITADGSGTSVYLRNLINQGALTAQNGGSLVFTGTNTTASLYTGAVNASGGHAYLNGTVDNTSATLSAPSTGIFELNGGTIQNGTVAANALTFTSSGGYLDNVTLNDNLTLPTSSYVRFTNGTNFTGTSATLGTNSGIYWGQVGTLAGKTLAFGSGSYVYVNGTNNTLTLDSATTATGDVAIYTDNSAGTAITNQGTINHTNGSGDLYAPTFTNAGTINASAGTSMYLGYYTGSTFTNTSTGIINLAGSWATIGSPTFTNAGQFNIQSGTLYTNNYLTNTATGTIKGAGTIYGSLTMAGGHLAPGNSIGTLTISNGNLTITAPSILDIELSGATADELVFQNPGGVLDIGAGLLSLNLALVGVPTLSTTYTILDITSGSTGLTGTFTGLPNSGDTLTALYSGTPYTFSVNYLTNSITLTSVPEPSTYALLGVGLALAAMQRRSGWRAR